LSRFWYVYIIEASDNSLYTGITTDMDRRWQEHLGANPSKAFKGAKFFRGRQPKRLVYLRQFENRSLASKQESFIKKLPRQKKIQLIKSAENFLDKLLVSLTLRCVD